MLSGDEKEFRYWLERFQAGVTGARGVQDQEGQPVVPPVAIDSIPAVEDADLVKHTPSE